MTVAEQRAEKGTMGHQMKNVVAKGVVGERRIEGGKKRIGIVGEGVVGGIVIAAGRAA